ncbi:hypothetical protein [Myxococcus sp. AB025B]|uniref:hypothetical protein n=1 Tax=Myxococcus sp. AB025B TaxID=2562794 RepID=UPI0011447238|nr:hypothetical protein [Myxococcus sp. AB025B]
MSATPCGGVGYPQGPHDALLTDNIDFVDGRDEWFFIQRGPTASWSISADWAGSNFSWNRSTHNSTPAEPFIGDWPLANNGGSNASHLLVRAVAGQPKHRVARRTFCSHRDMRMSNPWANH